MTQDKPDPRVEILRLLRLRSEQGPGPMPELDELVEVLGLTKKEVRRACDALEADGYVKGAHGLSGVTSHRVV